MEFCGKLVEADIADFARLQRSRWHWLSYLGLHIESLLWLGALVAVTTLKLWRGAALDWLTIGMMWGVVGAGGTWSWVRTRRQRKRDLDAVNAKMPDTIRVDDNGLVLDGTGSEIVPWDRFTGWRERRSVFVLDWSDDRDPAVFSTSSLSDAERDRLRDVLRSQIP